MGRVDSVETYFRIKQTQFQARWAPGNPPPPVKRDLSRRELWLVAKKQAHNFSNELIRRLQSQFSRQQK